MEDDVLPLNQNTSEVAVLDSKGYIHTAIKGDLNRIVKCQIDVCCSLSETISQSDSDHFKM